MDELLRQLMAPERWPAFVFITARLTGLMVIGPLWSTIGIPGTVRGAMVVLLALVLVPHVPVVPFPPDPLAFVLPLFTEFVVGLVTGLGAAVIMHAIGLASEILALQTGLSLGQVLTPNIETGGPALAQMQVLLGTAVFVSLSGHLTLVQGLADSLHAIPPGSALRSFDGGVAIVTQLGSLFGRAVQVAAPAMVALSVTNVAMAILSRAVPQLNAMAMSFAVMIGVGLIMVGVSLPFIASLVSRWTAALPTTLDTMVRSIAPGGGI